MTEAKLEIFQENLSLFLGCFEASHEGATRLIKQQDLLSHCVKKALENQEELERFLTALLIAVPRYLTEKEYQKEC